MNRLIMLLAGMLLAALLAASCSFPLTPELVAALKDDKAALCLRAHLSGGGAGMIAGPGMIPAGGYGTSEITLGRAGTSGMQVVLGADGSCSVLSADKSIALPPGHKEGVPSITPSPGVAPQKPQKPVVP